MAKGNAPGFVFPVVDQGPTWLDEPLLDLGGGYLGQTVEVAAHILHTWNT